MLQQIATKVAPAAHKQQPTVSILAADSANSYGNRSAEKSVRSAIFNAVTSVSEKQDDNVNAVMEYIDRNYANIEKQIANYIKMYGHEPSTQEAVAKVKEAGENLKQLVLADPDGIHQALEQIKAGRPEISQEHAIGLLIAELGNRNGGQSASGL